jgi:hypothetical protein
MMHIISHYRNQHIDILPPALAGGRSRSAGTSEASGAAMVAPAVSQPNLISLQAFRDAFDFLPPFRKDTWAHHQTHVQSTSQCQAILATRTSRAMKQQEGQSPEKCKKQSDATRFRCNGDHKGIGTASLGETAITPRQPCLTSLRTPLP